MAAKTFDLVPAVYYLVDGLKRRVARARGASPAPSVEAATA